MKVFTFLLVLIALVVGDLYLHNPRGSNDRLNEENTNRNNGNRLFDSQNNGKGGYCWGPRMNFYAGSQLTIEWTSQHACGNDKVWCNMVLQYMCGRDSDSPLARIRDGGITDPANTNTIPADVTGATATNANGDLTFGMHESLQHYLNCATRERQMGLWISDRESQGGLSPGRASAIFTRQNNNGNRNGLECAEERDYHPYWAPSPWRDIAVLADDTKYCGTYRDHSQNGRDKCHCVDPANPSVDLAPNNRVACTSLDATGTPAEWRCEGSFGISAPACIQAPWARDNHLGNGQTGYANVYNWTLPGSIKVASDPVNKPWDFDKNCVGDSDDPCVCVFRIRYNISTTDLNVGGGEIDGVGGVSNGNNIGGKFIDWKYNEPFSPIYDDQISLQDNLQHHLALDTSQFGRTFQDRTHTFQIMGRKSADVDNDNSRIYNLNVRGKRGNIVQAYPATEYDFVPEDLTVKNGDYIHFQWTGCDTNPAGNAGEGTDQTDRSNIVQIPGKGDSVPASDKWLKNNKKLFPDKDTRVLMAYIGQDLSVCIDLLDPNVNPDNEEQNVQNCGKLNAAPTPYFNGGVIKMTQNGDFHYMSSRNNNFTNRGQKA